MVVNRWREIHVLLVSLGLVLGCSDASGPEPGEGLAGSGGDGAGTAIDSGGVGIGGGTNAGGGSRGGSSGGAGSKIGSGGASDDGGPGGNGGTTGSGGHVDSGGGSGSGGSGGTPIPIHVGDCSNLPAKGTWENISPPNSNYAATYTGTNAVVLRPDNPSTVFVGADSAGIFRSEDCGSTWTKINTGMNAAAINSGRTWSLAMDPVVSDVMYAAQGYGMGGLWKTSNGGVDWAQVLTMNIISVFNAMGAIDSVALDPTDHTHLVVESHGAGPGPCQNAACLGESTDSGATWTLRTIAQGWSENSGVVLLSKKVWLYTALFGGLWRTTDEGETWQKLSGDYATANYYEPYVWQDAAGSYYIPTHQQGLLKSPPHDSSSFTTIPNSASGTVLFPSGESLFMGDEFNLAYHTASQSNPGVWTTFPGPPQKGTNSQGGAAVYMNYDGAHHILYSSNFNAGLWRTIVD